MPKKEVYVNLQDFLAKAIVESMTRNRPFERYYIPLATCIPLLQLGYETGAVLGYARGNKLDILNKMLSGTDMIFDNDNRIQDMQKSEKKRLDDFRKEHGEKPDTFADFIYWPLWESTIGLTLNDLFKSSGTETPQRKQERISNIIQKKLVRARVSSEEAQSRISLFLIKGLGFGSAFPELTAKMFENVYVCKKNDEELWEITNPLGFATPIDVSKRISLPTAKWRPPTLKRKERMILGTVAFYTSQYYPELLDSLDLSYYLYLVENEKL